jgi:tetratricopeptide (TPR) repeat protein
MKRGEFEESRAYFVKAYELQRLPEPLVYAAIASYKMNDIKWADYYIREADRYDCKGLTELRIDGYKALIFIREDNMGEGYRALQEYAEFYSHLKPLMNIWEVEAMVKKRRIDLVRLEILIDEQIDRYEDEIEQYRKTGTGPYGAGS